jgi:peptide/nickel transport system substrate-binding protein
LIKFKNTWRLNPELPVLAPWRTVQPINNPVWILERNPYFHEVDTEGNQLPYFDKIQMALAETLEVLNLRAIAGEYDIQERHVDIAKIPVFLENKDKGGYDLHLDPAVHGCDNTLYINQTYDGDAEVAKWLQTADFRRALALGIDRDQLNETYWIGLGTPGVAVKMVGARRKAGERAARQDRPRQEGRRGIPAADRQRPAPAAGRHDGWRVRH